ncbi:NAD(P)-dependent dehydrogenase (short-subunit alcohol dehydrogenase family) [Deinobacterium chartae]|uniref:NAD(P)-dependent dehydrogenase (Short-subunit alcohol dehydrogenase family) n=1 Tax=Deinobacterium chartae TaxID=521158 RepID=A0A841HXE0_9DEIO|nr:SDR family NAD(P)-dependent oxidoreductase [Deinobacterium chartae]MBB6098067.1 NAD(P)-dependent dehydrogenase (short-subunit alcohol dehydrogenase family) [Deinobacterium chartae]
MQDFQHKTAVVTGAASGIGFALARRALSEGMQVVMADIDAPALEQACRALGELGPVSARVTDVSDPLQVEALRDHALEAYGAVDLLCNNAGIGIGAGLLETTAQDWQWVMDVNLGGVLNGLRAFLPVMQARGGEGHIVNTASQAGVLPFHPSAPYQVSKAAVVALTEQLQVSLLLQGSPLRASVLCPGAVDTRILSSDRLRAHGRPTPPPPPAMMAQLEASVRAGLAPDVVAAQVFEALRRQDLYIVTDAEHLEHLERRLTAIWSAAALRAPAHSA